MKEILIAMGMVVLALFFFLFLQGKKRLEQSCADMLRSAIHNLLHEEGCMNLKDVLHRVKGALNQTHFLEIVQTMENDGIIRRTIETHSYPIEEWHRWVVVLSEQQAA